MLNKIREFILSAAITAVDAVPGILLGIGLVILIALGASRFNTPRNPERSVVAVLNKEQNGGGTGFTVRSPFHKNVIITNDHVCAVQENGLVRIRTDAGKVLLRRVLRTDPMRDLCVIEGVGAPELTVGSQPPTRFEEITVLGHPYLTPTVYAVGQYSHDEVTQVGSPSETGTCPEGSTAEESLFFYPVRA